MNNIVYCYKDLDTVGNEIAVAIEKLHGSSQIITHQQQVVDDKGSIVFHYPPPGPESDYVRELSVDLAKMKNVRQVPSVREMALHGRIVDQYVTFGQWMPSAWLFRSMDEVKEKINEIEFPIISLSNNGEKRILKEASDGLIEAAELFRGKGYPLTELQRRQTGYAFWTIELIQQMPSWRVIMFAKKYAIVIRHGDGKIFPMDVISEQIVELLKYVFAFMLDNSFSWGSVEVLAGGDRVRRVASPFISFYSANWPKDWFLDGGMIFETETGEQWKSTGIPAIRWYELVAKCILEGDFNE